MHLEDGSSADEFPLQALGRRGRRRGPRRGPGRLGVVAAVGTVAVLLVGGGAVAWASSADDDPHGADHGDGPGGHGDRDRHADENGTQARRRHEERHEALTPYPERHAAASAGERDAADLILAGTGEALAAYADVDAAVAAGYEAPRRTRGNRAHYLNPSFARDDDLLDPAHPEGLVYYTGGPGDPVLLGAFFVAPKGAEAPSPAGDLALWHSHSRRCPGFFATDDEPCTGTRRMLHIWTADDIVVPARRGSPGGPAQVVDPFATPFGAALEAVDPVEAVDPLEAVDPVEPVDPTGPAGPVD